MDEEHPVTKGLEQNFGHLRDEGKGAEIETVPITIHIGDDLSIRGTAILDGNEITLYLPGNRQSATLAKLVSTGVVKGLAVRPLTE